MSVNEGKVNFMDDNKKMYQLFVIVFMLVLLTGGILIGIAVSKENEKVEISKEIIDEIVEEVKSKDVEVYKEEYEEVQDVEIVYVDIYNDCDHASESRSNEYGVNINKVKERELEKIQKENSGYKLVQETDGILMFEKFHNCKCKNHYMLKFQNNIVVIFRYNEQGEYEIYQETDIQKEGIRPDLSFRLEEGIEAETVEELYMFLEELES